MKTIQRSILLFISVFIIIISFSCDKIINTPPVSDKWRITLLEVENLSDNKRIDFAYCLLNATLSIKSGYYEPTILWSAELWSAGYIWKIQPSERLMINNSGVYYLDKALMPDAALEIKFDGIPYIGRAVDVYHIEGKGVMHLTQKEIYSDLIDDGVVGNTSENCYYLDIDCVTHLTNNLAGTFRLKIRIDPILD